MQGYDSVALQADVEIGGDDQLFNLLAGRVLQEAYNQAPQNVLTFELLEGADGRKMSKSYGNVINIDDSAKEMFGKTMSVKDELIIRYFTLCTKKPMEEITEIEKQLQGGMNPRDAKILLAKELVTMYHSVEDAEAQEQEFLNVFSKGELPSDIPTVELDPVLVASGNLIEILFATGLVESKSEGKRVIEQGGVQIDSEKVTDVQFLLKKQPREKVLLKVGKRKFLYVTL